MTTSTYLKPDERRAKILAAAVKLADQRGYMNLTRDLVAHAADCSPALVNHYFADMEGLRREVVREAVAREVLRVIAQAIINRHACVRRIAPDLRNKALTAFGK